MGLHDQKNSLGIYLEIIFARTVRLQRDGDMRRGSGKEEQSHEIHAGRE